MEQTPAHCVLFDLDNTLVPFLPAVRAWAQAWATNVVPSSKRRELADELVRLTLEGGEDPARGIQRVRALWNIHADDEALEAARAGADRAYRASLRPYPRIGQALEDLAARGCTLAVVTDAPDARATERLQATDLARHFSLVVARDHTRSGKNGPEPFLKALNLLQVPATDTVMVGDWPRYDVRWPKRLGMRTVLAGWGCQEGHRPRSIRDRPWAVAECPADLPGLIDGPPASQPLIPTPQHVKPLTAF